MKLNGRRESSNVDDRRGKASGIAGIGGLGIGGVIIYLLFSIVQLKQIRFEDNIWKDGIVFGGPDEEYNTDN